MIQNKHTPGPWNVIEGTRVFTDLGAESGDGLKADDNDGWMIADCRACWTSVDGEPTDLTFKTANANAVLIAAAPDLLEALESIIASARAGNAAILDRLTKQAEDAIAKARGDQP